MVHLTTGSTINKRCQKKRSVERVDKCEYIYRLPTYQSTNLPSPSLPSQNFRKRYIIIIIIIPLINAKIPQTITILILPPPSSLSRNIRRAPTRSRIPFAKLHLIVSLTPRIEALIIFPLSGVKSADIDGRCVNGRVDEWVVQIREIVCAAGETVWIGGRPDRVRIYNVP